MAEAIKEFLADGTTRHTMEIARFINSKLPFPVKEGSCATACWKLAKEGAIENVRKGVYRINLTPKE